jgi:NAD(P)-dependent dehydrogenase (short-subunit alcohol dehydrogenase family)
MWRAGLEACSIASSVESRLSGPGARRFRPGSRSDVVTLDEMTTTGFDPDRQVWTTALITGAASGIGRELAMQLGREGCTIAMIDVDAARLARAGSDVERVGGQVETRVLDVSDLDGLAEAVNELADILGGFDLCAPLAGVFVGGHWDDATVADWELAFRVNALHAIVASSTALEWSRTNGRRCHVLVAGSDSVLETYPDTGPYTASKSALTSFALAVGTQLADEESLGLTLGLIFPTRTRFAHSTSARLGTETTQLENLDVYLTARGDEISEVVSSLLQGVREGARVVNTDLHPTRRRRIAYRASPLVQRLLPAALALLITPPRSKT